MKSNNICKLCGKRSKLEISHIIPKFVYKWIKKTSATKKLREGSNPDKRIQDGYKLHFLCGECEDIFSNYENKFAEKIFHPLHNDKSIEQQYGEWLLKFATSISWRSLKYIRDRLQNDYSPEIISHVDKALEVWELYLLEKIQHPGEYRQHLIPMGSIESHTDNNVPKNINRYILRAVEIDFVTSGNQCFIYSKLCGVVILGFINMKNSSHWKNTKINRNGTIANHFGLPEYFANYFFDQAKKAAASIDSISDKQKEIISNAWEQNKDIAHTTVSFKALQQDYELFGEDAFETGII